MLRYRVAIMLILFFLLALASTGQLETASSFKVICGILSLLFSYIAATSINDIIDKDIDKINHPKSSGRPLVSGEANEKDLYLVHTIAALLALLFAFFINVEAFFILLISLGINYVYSVPPLKFSYRTHFAPLLLTLAYVGIPFSLGLAVVGIGTLSKTQQLLPLALIIIFLGRIILKDFRDREGDAKYGKPTFLLRYGKKATCFFSFLTILLGNVLLFFAISFLPWTLWILIEVFFLAIYVSLYKLYKTDELLDEQRYIGLGAKMGNGFLISLLGVYILKFYQATFTSQLFFLLFMLSLLLTSFFFIIKNPTLSVNAYKG